MVISQIRRAVNEFSSPLSAHAGTARHPAESRPHLGSL